jgi:hypothetical protein
VQIEPTDQQLQQGLHLDLQVPQQEYETVAPAKPLVTHLPPLAKSPKNIDKEYKAISPTSGGSRNF